MGSKNDVKAPEAAVVVEPPESKDQMERRKKDYFKKGEDFKDKDELSAIEYFQDALDLEVFINCQETDFSFECFTNLAHLYSKVSLNHIRPHLYGKRLANHLTFQVLSNPGTNNSQFSLACFELAKALHEIGRAHV